MWSRPIDQGEKYRGNTERNIERKRVEGNKGEIFGETVN
jgi:hypothetical protein